MLAPSILGGKLNAGVEQNARFEIVVPGRVYYLFCDTGDECRAWVTKLNEASGRRPSLRPGSSGAMTTSRKQVRES